MNRILKFFNCLINPQFVNAYKYKVSPLFEITPLIMHIKDANTLIDIGSNKGQFSLILRKYLKDIFIYSFEPQYTELKIQKKILKKYNIKYFNFAIGNRNKETKFYITNRKDSSSLLKPSSEYGNDYIIEKVKIVKVKKLIDFLNFKKLKQPIILKLDVQGYELDILRSIEKQLKFIKYIITEISHQTIYKDQVFQLKLLNFLKKNSYKIVKKTNQTYRNGKLFQEDVLLEKI